MGKGAVLETARGPVRLRPERVEDGAFLFALFRSHALTDLAQLPIDDTTREGLVRMQFESRNATYRVQYPDARFEIMERDGTPIGRVVVQEDADAALIVDYALIPECRGSGLGTAILTELLARLGERVPVVRNTVSWNNEASLRMCRRVGFVQTGGEIPSLKFEWRPGQ